MIIAHRWPGEVVRGTLVARPNKFLAICRIGRRTVEAHVPDRGRCLDLLVPGRELGIVRLQASDLRPQVRRTRYTAVLACSGQGTWVSLDPGGAPRLVEEALRRKLLPGLAGYQVVRREVAVGQSRIDLLLACSLRPEARGLLCEVKSVGAQEQGIALFPDAPTTRGVRHLELLARRGANAAVVFCAQRGDVDAVAPDHAIDPDFGKALRRADRAGVRLLALRCAAHPDGMEIEGEIPVLS